MTPGWAFQWPDHAACRMLPLRSGESYRELLVWCGGLRSGAASGDLETAHFKQRLDFVGGPARHRLFRWFYYIVYPFLNICRHRGRTNTNMILGFYQPIYCTSIYVIIYVWYVKQFNTENYGVVSNRVCCLTHLPHTTEPEHDSHVNLAAGGVLNLPQLHPLCIPITQVPRQAGMLNVFHDLPKHPNPKLNFFQWKPGTSINPYFKTSGMRHFLWAFEVSGCLRRLNANSPAITCAFSSTKPHQQHQHSKWLCGFKYVPFWKNLLQKSLAWQNRRVFSRDFPCFSHEISRAFRSRFRSTGHPEPSFFNRCPEPRIEYHLQRFAPESLENDLAIPPSRSAKLMVFPDPKGVRIFFLAGGNRTKKTMGIYVVLVFGHVLGIPTIMKHLFLWPLFNGYDPLGGDRWSCEIIFLPWRS